MVVRGLPSGTRWDDEVDMQQAPTWHANCRCFGPRALNRLVKVYCVLLIPDGDAKRHKVYTGSGNRCPTSSLRDRSCIPCTEVLVVGGYKLGERGELVPGLGVERCGLLETLLSGSLGERVST